MRPAAAAFARAAAHCDTRARFAEALKMTRRFQMLTRTGRWAALCALLTTVGGCNLNRLTANTTAGMLDFGSVAMDREADIEFARYAFPASLKTVETFLVSSPDNEHLLLLLARGYNSYAFGILESDLDRAKLEGTDEAIEDLVRRSKIHYLRGREYGFRLLNNAKLKDAAFADDFATLDAELAKLKKEDMPGLFWAAYGWASATNLSIDDPDLVASLPVIERLMLRAYELEPGYNEGSPILFHAVYAASKPQMAGGDPAVAKKYFDEAMASHGESNLLVPFLYARFYCAQTQDRKLFDELMNKIASADVSKYPETRLMNEIARDRARFWSAHVDEIILEP
jgi:hypothetical protein